MCKHLLERSEKRQDRKSLIQRFTRFTLYVNSVQCVYRVTKWGCTCQLRQLFPLFSWYLHQISIRKFNISKGVQLYENLKINLWSGKPTYQLVEFNKSNCNTTYNTAHFSITQSKVSLRPYFPNFFHFNSLKKLNLSGVLVYFENIETTYIIGEK